MSSDGYSGVSLNCGPAPPPPPPPPASGPVPGLRISTATEAGPRRGAPAQESYEPPAAIQNAMMTKDKKPFTYTPGMGGKLDLSQIRSPRMARRVAKNANDEGIEAPPQEVRAPATVPVPASTYSPPQVAVAVLPQGRQPLVNLRNSCLPRAQPTSPNSPPTPASPTSPTSPSLTKAPTPWMQKPARQPDELPEWARRQQHEPTRVSVVTQVPLNIEDRPSVFSAINEPGHHQFANSSPHHMSRWGNPVGMSGHTQQQQPTQQDNHSQPQYRNAPQMPDNRNVQRAYAPPAQPDVSPVQSQSFRVLQKITDTYADQLDGEQLRKMQLTEDDRYLMNKFKEQVDGDTYLHQEADPRYRGAAIPSRAFRYLQNMTDSADLASAHSTAARPANSVPKKPNRHSNTFEEVPMQPYIPASQQQVQEPKKYTGGAIPSRSFRILQAMTTPESIGSPWEYNSSSTPSSSTITTGSTDDRSEVTLEEQALSSPEKKRSSSSLDENDDDDDDDDEEEQAVSFDSSDSSCDSESYLAYSTGLNPLSRQKERQVDENTYPQKIEIDEERESESTDCEKMSHFEDDNSAGENEEKAEAGNTCVSVSLALRSESSVETSVDFTLKRATSRDVVEELGPSIVATAKDGEEPTDDEDSGVTSDTSRLISEADTDSECHQLATSSQDASGPETRNIGKSKKYQRTQTHSRLFKLLSEEKSLSESEKGRGNWCSEPRPRPLSWQVYPRVNVLCPRTKSAKNIPRIVALRGQSCNSTIASNIPTGLRLKYRC